MAGRLMKQKLLPCKCGEKPYEYYENLGDTGEHCYMIWCVKCHEGVCELTEVKAQKAWNQRTGRKG